jgi:ABC-type uncharacterized transport system permease subunit
MQSALSLVSAALYLLSSVFIAIILRERLENKSVFNPHWLLLTWGGALVIHAVSLYGLLVTPEGLDLGFFRALSTVGWLAAALLIVSCFGRASISLGLILLPLAGLTAVLAATLPEISFIPRHTNPGLDLHIFISLLAYSLLTLATLQALLLSYQNRHLHNHRPGGLIRILPSLQEMERMLFQFITVGFVLLTIALGTGFLYLDNIFAQHLVHKTILSFAAWIIFGILLWGHWQFGWRGKLAVRWTVGGFIVLMLAYFGSKLVLELILGQA